MNDERILFNGVRILLTPEKDIANVEVPFQVDVIVSVNPGEVKILEGSQSYPQAKDKESSGIPEKDWHKLL